MTKEQRLKIDIIKNNMYTIREILKKYLDINTATEIEKLTGLEDGKWQDMKNKEMLISPTVQQLMKDAMLKNFPCDKVNIYDKYFNVNKDICYIINNSQYNGYVEDYFLMHKEDKKKARKKTQEYIKKYIYSDEGYWLVKYIIKYKGRKDFDISRPEEINDPVFKSVFAEIKKINKSYESKELLNKVCNALLNKAYNENEEHINKIRENRSGLRTQNINEEYFNAKNGKKITAFEFNFLVIYYVLFYGELEDSSRIDKIFKIKDIKTYDIKSNETYLKDTLYDKRQEFKTYLSDDSNAIVLTNNSMRYFNVMCETKSLPATEIVRRTVEFELYVAAKRPRADFLKLLLLAPYVSKNKKISKKEKSSNQ